MTPTILHSAERAKWREMLAPPERSHASLALILFLVSAIALPLSANPSIALGFSVVCLVFLYSLTHSLTSLLIYVAPAFLLWSFAGLLPGLPNTLALPAAFLATLMGGACGAFYLLHHHHPRKHFYLFLLPIGTYLTVFAVTADPFRGLLTLLPFAVAVLLALCVSFCVPQTDSVVACTALLTLSLAVAGVITLAVTGHGGGGMLPFVANTLHDSIVNLYTQAQALYAELGLDASMLSDVDVANLAAMFVNVSPALFVVICTVTSFLCWRTLLGLLVGWQTLPRPPFRLAALSVSSMAAVVFLLTFIISLFANSPVATLTGVVCQNLSLVLEPVMVLVGFRSIFHGASRRSCLSTLLAIGLLFILFTNPATGLALTAFFGAINILLARFFPDPEKE